MRQKAIGVLEAMVAALRMFLARLAGIEKNEQTTDVPFFSWNHNKKMEHVEMNGDEWR